MGAYHVHQYDDKHIFVRADNGEFWGGTAEEFQQDFGFAPPQTEVGIERIYEQGKRHTLMKGSDVIDGGPVPWREGDRIIKVVSAAKSKKDARREAEGAAIKLAAAADTAKRFAELVPPQITDIQFFHALAVRKIITEEQALAAVKSGELPSAMTDMINAMPNGERFATKMQLAGTTVFLRKSPLMRQLANKFHWSEADVDALFKEASQT